MAIHNSWLTQPIAILELEKQLGFKFDALKNIGASSNRWLEVWSKFAKLHQGTDELWLYAMPQPPDTLEREEGVALVRKGKIVSHVTTVSN